MAKNNPLIISNEGGLSHYLNEIRKFPLLKLNEEYMLAKRFKEHQDSNAAKKLITSHLRLVAKIAMSYRGYGLPISEIISEGNIGLMQAVKKFEPDRGFRLATYAMWWIKASIQEYVLRTWSLVKMGTTSNQKKIFFNLRRIKGQIKALEDGDMYPDQVKLIAEKLNVPESDIISMNRRLSGDTSLNTPISTENGSSEWQDLLTNDEIDNQEMILAKNQELNERHKMLILTMKNLNKREHAIFKARRLKDKPITLENLSQKYKISRERIRQIEVRAFEKIQQAMCKIANERNL